MEIAILALIASGYTDKMIGYRLGIAEKTVKNHLQVIYTRLRVHNRTLAVVRAYRKGYITLVEIP